MEKSEKEQGASHQTHSSAHSQQAHQAADLFEQAMKSYEQALRTGVRFQEDTAKWWTNFLHQAACTQDWQRQINSIMLHAIPTAQKNMEESLRLIDQSSKNGLNLWRRAVDAPRGGSASDVQSQVQDIWQSSLNVLQSNMQAITESQTRVMESWTEFVRRGVGSTASAAASK